MTLQNVFTNGSTAPIVFLFGNLSDSTDPYPFFHTWICADHMEM